MTASLGGYSQTGPRGPDDYQLRPHELPPVKLVVEPFKPAKTKPHDQNGNFEMADGKESASMKPGGGGRFAAMKAKLGGRKGVSDPAALAAYIGRMKYGRQRFQEMSAKGRSK